MTGGASAHFAESIPTGMDDIAGTDGVEPTADALIRLTNAARETIDLTAMYWALQPDPASEDEKGWSAAVLRDQFGAWRGMVLHAALAQAAARGVAIRIIQSPGFGDGPTEADALQERFPDRVTTHEIQMEDWYGSGIMHQKIWVFDGHAVYIGSANMDWKSLTQVKELGLVLEHAPDIAGEVSRYFETWWAFSGMQPPSEHTARVADPTSLIERTVPDWSTMVPQADRAPDPLDKAGYATQYGWETPMRVALNGETGDLALSGAPQELCVGARTFDGEMLVNTIMDARTSVCIAVMDFAPVSLYQGKWSDKRRKYMVGGEVAAPVWWPALVDALLHVVSTRKVRARLLISEWAHTSPFIRPYLEALTAAARAAGASHSMETGLLEVRRFRVPGWRDTGPHDQDEGQPLTKFPGHTRVNHTKFIVTDQRINVGTSNMTWDYFNGTAGASLNATHRGLVEALQAIFDRDWNSDYALPLAD